MYKIKNLEAGTTYSDFKIITTDDNDGRVDEIYINSFTTLKDETNNVEVTSKYGLAPYDISNDSATINFDVNLNLVTTKNKVLGTYVVVDQDENTNYASGTLVEGNNEIKI